MDGNTKVRSHSSGMSQPPHPEPHILASPNASISLAERTKMDSQEPDTAEIQDSAGLPTRPFTLILISHSHAPPLVPKPQLKFDLRKTSNPPKNIRDAYDGRSKRLREHMMAGDDFCALLDTAQTRIGEQMSSFAGPGRGDPEDTDDRSTELRVGCFCELGRHRSVAFVEELARRKWPSEWEVEINHRDVDQSKNKNKNQHHKQSRRDNQKFVGSGLEQ